MVLVRWVLVRSLVGRVVTSVVRDVFSMSFRSSPRSRSLVSEVLAVDSFLYSVVLHSFVLFDVVGHSPAVFLVVFRMSQWFASVVS